jgi:hypothetical protein
VRLFNYGAVFCLLIVGAVQYLLSHLLHLARATFDRLFDGDRRRGSEFADLKFSLSK